MLTVKFVKKSLQIFVTIVVVLSMTSFIPARNVGAQQALPTIRVTPAIFSVFSSGWGNGVSVTLEVDDPLTGNTPDCTVSKTANPDVYFSSCPVKAGDVVTVSGGEITVAYTVELLEITQKDTVNDIISGIAEPNQQVFMHLDLDFYNHIDIDTFSDENGHWVFDFSKLTPPIDLVFGSGDTGNVHVVDGAGNSTSRPFRFWDPKIKVNLNANTITGEDFSSGETIHLKVDDPGTPENPDYQTSAVVSMQNEFFGLDFPMEPSYIKPGFLIEMSGDQITKQITFSELVITEIDRNISGIGKPNSDLTLYAFYPDDEDGSPDCYQVVEVDSSGHWAADEGRWFKTYQNPYYCLSIMNGLRLEAYQYDGDNDYIFTSKTILPTIQVNATAGGFFSDNWGQTTVTFSVDDPQTVQSPDCSESVYLEWGGAASSEDCRAKVGDIITVTGDGVSTVYTVPLLDVTKIDVANNIIEGIADPNKQISLQLDVLWPAPDLTTMADENGNWKFDLSTLSPPVDLKFGVWGKVYLADEAGNYIWDRIDVTVPHLYVFLNTSTIHGYNFLPSEMITLRVDDPNTPQNPDYETTAKNPKVDWNPDLEHPVKFELDQSFPLKPGYVVEVSDSAFTKRITLWNLSVTSVDLAKDTVSGTSSRFDVYEYDGVEVYEKTADTYWGVWRYSYFDNQGNWSVDFANPDADPDGWGRTLDVKPGTRLWVLQYENHQEEDFDAVALDWTVPLNTPPVADAGGPYTTQEGTPVTLDASLSSDPDGDMLTYEWDLNADGVFDDATVVDPQVTFPDDGLYDVSVRVTDPSGAQDIATAQVTVLNVAPTIDEPLNLPAAPVLAGTTVNASAIFADPGLLDIHAAIWDWGDGTNKPGVINGTNVTGSHVYTTPGLYTVVLSVSDDDGGSDLAMYQYVVVFDPKAGFASGGGWLKSPKDAHFAFLAYYPSKRAAAPMGSVVVQFKPARLYFNSTKFEWLVVNGSKAYIKGSGTVNGKGDYAFLLSVVDGGRKDMLRIKIWDKATGTVIYDCQPGAADDANPTALVGGGSIIVHK